MSLFHSTRPSIILDCSHSIHKDCLDKQIQNNKLNEFPTKLRYRSEEKFDREKTGGVR